MATTNDLKNGMVLNLDGQLWQVIWFQHHKPGKGGAVVRSKLKNVESGKTVDKTFNADVKVEVRQTNHEGDMLDWLNEAADEHTPVVLNAGAWTHYSLALFDACAQLTAPLVEVHLSDPGQRP